MTKLLTFFDNHLVKIGVIFALIFTVLYPKLPSIQVTHTWVYIRLEDFAIALVVGIWLVQVIRKKARLAFPVGIPILIYWLVGGASLVFCLLFIGPHLANFFPKIAALEWIRRIEYMILFFVAFSTIKSVKDIRDYLIALCVAVGGVVMYGLGQHYYLTFWHLFPNFFEKYPFCFPSFQTGNEEFAKGIPLCLPVEARTTSTFGGHYDLAAYLVLVLPIIFTFILAVKHKLFKILLTVLFLSAVTILLFTASRTSFATYLIGITATIFFLKKKKLLLPVWLVSIVLLFVFSSSTAQRFLDTIRLTSVITNSQGQVVGVAQSSLPTDLQNKISKNRLVVSDIIPSQNLPTGSSFITLPQAPVATNVAVIKSKIDPKEAERLKLQYGGLEISTISGNFLVQKALVYDISFTTRFQAEWPRDFAAFISSPVFGTGYSSLTLASDNDYLRALGETGALGLIAFLAIFLIFGIFLTEVIADTNDRITALFALGLAGGVIGLFANATLIDVFESSKVAESLWILLGIGVGGLMLFQKEKILYGKHVLKFLTSHCMIGVELLLVALIAFGKSVNNFFIGDDFTWLHWAASATFHDIARYFVNAQDFFYRPLDKMVMLFLYTFFAFQPQGYHVFSIFVHFLVAFGLYCLLFEIFGKKLWACVGSLLFLLLPGHGENLFWISTISPNLATLFIVFGLLTYNTSQKTRNWVLFTCSMVLAVLGLLSYEMAVIFPLLILALDIFMKRSLKRQWVQYILFFALDGFYFLLRSVSHTVVAGGDYSYNLYHIIPNMMGNFLGYISLFLFGEQAIGWNSLLRMNAKIYVFPLTGVFLLLVVIAGTIFWKNQRMLQRPTVRIFIFGIIFGCISLLPFLGLGNMSERYLYLASVGFTIAIVAIFRSLIGRYVAVSAKATVIVVGIVSIFLILWLGYSIQKEENDWQHAGKITYNTLGYFKIEQDSLPKGSTLYIVNRPIRYANAWVFPVGLSDGLWFVYRDDTQVVHDVPSIAKAQEIVGKTYPYIFIFDEKGKIHQAK